MKRGFGVVGLLVVIVLVALLSVFAFKFFVAEDEETQGKIRTTTLNTFELSAKLILQTAETTSLLEDGEVSCYDLMNLSIGDYGDCKVTFTNNKASIDIYGKKDGRFNNFHCVGTSHDMKCTSK